jgi:hypothetical protein
MRDGEGAAVISLQWAPISTCFAAGLLLAGCTSPDMSPAPPAAMALYPPWTLNATPEEIALRWYPDATPSAAAAEAARIHCGNWYKSAVLVSDTRDGSAEIAQYRCR